MISRETLSELMLFVPEQYLITSLYLAIEGSSQPSYAIALKDLIKQRKSELDNLQLPGEVRRSVDSDISKIQEFVTLKFSREKVRTLVLFSCSARKWWKVLTLNLSLRSQLTVGPVPALRPLFSFLDEYRRFLVIVVERSKARLFEVYAGEILEHSRVLDEVPSRVRMGGFSGYEEKRIARHIEDHVRRHFKNVADAANELFKKQSYDHVLLCGSEQNTSEFRHYLLITLQERIVAVQHEDINAPPKVILERTMSVEKELKHDQQRKLLARLFSQVNSGGLGILGLDSTIRALQHGQVNALVVQDGYDEDGYRCNDCRSLLTGNGSCDYCGGATRQVKNIVEEAVEQALLQGCEVKYITLPDSQLASAGNIGAMLRFKV